MVEIGPRLKRILRKAGYEYYRPAKGDHEIWRHSETKSRSRSMPARSPGTPPMRS